MLADMIAAVVNPTPERVTEEAAWQGRHPVITGAALAAILTGLVPALIAGLLA